MTRLFEDSSDSAVFLLLLKRHLIGDLSLDRVPKVHLKWELSVSHGDSFSNFRTQICSNLVGVDTFRGALEHSE